MNDGEIAEPAHHDVLRFQAGDSRRPAHPAEECLAIQVLFGLPIALAASRIRSGTGSDPAPATRPSP